MQDYEKEDHLPSKFYYDLGASEKSNGESQEAIYDFIKKTEPVKAKKIQSLMIKTSNSVQRY